MKSLDRKLTHIRSDTLKTMGIAPALSLQNDLEVSDPILKMEN